MSRFDSRQDVAFKVAWEGGLYEALEYGIKVNDLPEGDTELAEAWRALDGAHTAFEEAAEKVRALLPEGE
ncbi:hypothetical protein Skr01_36480 [Sphaerisporangium krabiense]|uniref:Uncharacterized protein n=1 Tax=Sphaerisporangium krabiense TaxID=763782 RepID=A0A7W8Z3E6_9ACTN|nr:hypothetical protein [Sphaerisporangium krabiense]MBB5626642.1 hypothetical protein [Sphaerisporangium krabiense]GII63563.1 hypothetical protein Skr01_36480 [Sphaerisporangium krabiense]